MPKKISGLLLALIVCFGALSGCEGSPKGKAAKYGNYVFYNLDELYDSGELTKDDILSIAYYLNGINEENSYQFPEGYSPIPKTPAELGEAAEKAAAEAYTEFINYPTCDYRFLKYLGTYGEYTAVCLDNIFGGTTAIETYYAGGVEYSVGDSGTEVVAYRINSGSDEESYDEYVFYDLQKLYDDGEISRDDLLDLAARFNGSTFNANKDKYPEGYRIPYWNTRLHSLHDRYVLGKAYTAFVGDEHKYYGYQGYYGTYNGYNVVCLDERYYEYPDVFTEMMIDDLVFIIRINGSLPVAYKIKPSEEEQPPAAPIEGEMEYEFYTLQELYDYGELSRQDLLSVAYHFYNGISQENADLYPEDFLPAPKTPAELDEDTKEAVADAYTALLDSYLCFRFVFYCGTYGDYAVVVLNEWKNLHMDVVVHTVVDGVTFEFPDTSYALVAYKVK